MNTDRTSPLVPRSRPGARIAGCLLLGAIVLGSFGCRSVGSRSSWELLNIGSDRGWSGVSQTFEHLEGGTGLDEVAETWEHLTRGPEGGFGVVLEDSGFFIEPFSWDGLRSTFRHLR